MGFWAPHWQSINFWVSRVIPTDGGVQRKLESFVMDSDRVCQQRQSITPIKAVLDQDRLKYNFVGLRTPAGSRIKFEVNKASLLPKELEFKLSWRTE